MKFHASYNLLQALKITTIFVSIGYAFIIAVFNEQSTKVLMLKEEIEGSEHSLSENMYIDLRTLIMLNFGDLFIPSLKVTTKLSEGNHKDIMQCKNII
ncbi:hypothetical protein RirG_181310 [Rhizophagus irregularis DAOM 197198w]|uniref:Uncharacterized protein n=4 Tax=Rhizophagus irregularis TaxID=588596 RepID=A0A015JYY0_RHIIW|nr:hypothetical protein RirG_181310 [Rhizophagus irregularis DAOM 197198w]